MTDVPIAEMFYSIQGEGPHAGTPAIFLRMAGCNLCCGGYENMDRDKEDMQPEGEATWTCDTIDVWREAERHIDPNDLLDEWEARGFLPRLSEGAHLVLTGGEPMLPANVSAISGLMGALHGRGIEPYVEVETNGTIEPDVGMWNLIDQWNVSLKLSNSGMEEEDRINPNAIEFFNITHEEITDPDATFKFVVSDIDDAEEVFDLVESYDIPDSMVSLMPAGQTQEQLRETYPEVAEICKAWGWDFSPRLQIDAWSQATGV